MTDLLKRLREDGRNGHNPLCLEAADSIEQLEAENARLQLECQAQYDRGYYDGRQFDGAEERAKIVAYARGHGGNAWSRDVLYFADKIEAGDWK